MGKKKGKRTYIQRMIPDPNKLLRGGWMRRKQQQAVKRERERDRMRRSRGKEAFYFFMNILVFLILS